MKLDEASSVLRRVDRAMENINAYLSHHMDDEEGAKKREHPRFQKDDMYAKFIFVDHPRHKEKVFQVKLFDISVGGMCLEIDHQISLQLKDSIKFSVYQSESTKPVVKGVGKIVRIRKLKENQQVGIQFLGVVQK